MDGRTFRVSKLEPDIGRVELQDVTFANAVGFPIFRVEPISVIRQHLEQKPEPAQPGFTTEPVTVYPGDKNHLPYDVVVQTLRTNELEPPAPAIEPEKTLDEVLDEHPISVQVNGEWRTFPNARAAEEASL